MYQGFFLEGGGGAQRQLPLSKSPPPPCMKPACCLLFAEFCGDPSTQEDCTVYQPMASSETEMVRGEGEGGEMPTTGIFPFLLQATRDMRILSQ